MYYVHKYANNYPCLSFLSFHFSCILFVCIRKLVHAILAFMTVILLQCDVRVVISLIRHSALPRSCNIQQPSHFWQCLFVNWTYAHRSIGVEHKLIIFSRTRKRPECHYIEWKESCAQEGEYTDNTKNITAYIQAHIHPTPYSTCLSENPASACLPSSEKSARILFATSEAKLYHLWSIISRSLNRKVMCAGWSDLEVT